MKTKKKYLHPQTFCATICFQPLMTSISISGNTSGEVGVRQHQYTNPWSLSD